MTFRDLRRAIVASNRSVIALDSRYTEVMAQAGLGIARGDRERAHDAYLAELCGADARGTIDKRLDTSDAEAIATRAEKLALPAFVPAGKSGQKTAIVSFRGLVTYDIEFQPYAVSTRNFAAVINQLAADETVKSIVILVDSPGGTVVGLPEAADALWNARQVKKCTAVVDTLCASAGYYVASQATEITALPSGIGVGSIGVRMMHMDCAEMMAQAGVKVTHIHSAPYKVEGNPFEPLSEEARARYQLECDTLYAQFVGAVARGRSVDAETVRETFGQGRVLMPAEAKRVGMIDRLETPQQALGRVGAALVTAEADKPEPQAETENSDSNAVKVSVEEIVNKELTASEPRVDAACAELERERELLALASY